MAEGSLVSVREARERSIAILSELFAADDLELDEFERRVSLVHRAATVAEIDEVVRDVRKPDLAVKPQPSVALVPAADVQPAQTTVAIFGGVTRHGTWTAPRQMRIIAVFGGAELDFREARLAAGTTDINVFAWMGGVQIIVPPGLAVEVVGSAFMGGFAHLERTPPQADPDRPVVRVHGFVMMGGVSVETRLPGESEREARRRARRERRASRRQERKS
jgi:hypothetical protein